MDGAQKILSEKFASDHKSRAKTMGNGILVAPAGVEEVLFIRAETYSADFFRNLHKHCLNTMLFVLLTCNVGLRSA